MKPIPLFNIKLFLWLLALFVLPFAMLRLANFQLKELPFMFIAILGLVKFYLAQAQDQKSLEYRVKRRIGQGASKQQVVDATKRFKTSQDVALLAAGVLILISNIIL